MRKRGIPLRYPCRTIPTQAKTGIEWATRGADRMYMETENDDLTIKPDPATSLLAVLATLKQLREEFPPITDLPPDAVEL